jgi:hypothetical protein
MENIIENIIDSRIKNLLEIININYPDKFNKQLIDKEFKYIKNHIKFIKYKKNKTPKIKDTESNDSISETTTSETTTSETTTSEKTITSKIKTQIKTQILENNQCCARTWNHNIIDRKTDINIEKNKLDPIFNVFNYKDINNKLFNNKYKIGLRCKNVKYLDTVYCKLHNKHLIHGNYNEIPSKELCYHFIKDGKYL